MSVRIQRRAINTIREREPDRDFNNMQTNFERLWSDSFTDELHRRALPTPDYIPPLRRAMPDTNSVPRYLQSTYSARKKMLEVPPLVRAQPTVFTNKTNTLNAATASYSNGRPKSRSPIEDLYATDARRALVTCATASSAAKQKPPVHLRSGQMYSQSTSNIQRSSTKKSKSGSQARSSLKPATSDTELSRRSSSPSYSSYFRETSTAYPEYNGYASKSYTSSIMRQNLQPVTLSPRLARRSLTALNRLTQIANEGRKKLEASSPAKSSSTLRRNGTFTKDEDHSSRHVIRRSTTSTSTRQRPVSIAATGLWRSSYTK
ncbi:uncharacterized protein LOC100907564 [Galendromus occidentalis]|uniref:Uncharacterized protein LOC100907564 n=1 Tax=Galendromus occidentalis TaxID=34638 RepID=A0AAJ6QSA3_9ACAR|nr:uncharacterized protein LOC100907564 [Galendromus occidentalis]